MKMQVFCCTLLLLVGLFSCAHAANVVQHFEKLQDLKNDGKFNGTIWVLLIAGSSGYYNYRHQADVCHAYQIVHKHGIPDEQVVVMMYDDIAYAEANPTKGIIINHPDGPDVYKGVLKDYTKGDVTPTNFLNVLKGNSEAMNGIGSGKVIASGPDDHVFVYFADHGAPGLIAFPTSELVKDDLNNAIQSMYNQKQYAQLVFYIEACESGSMFENILPDSINVYATTAANSEESSYACYFDQKRQTYLGDRYSVSWLEDSDQENIESETLHNQFKVAKAETNQSHVMQFGDTSMSHEIVGFFQGEEPSAAEKPLRKIYDDVPSPDVTIHILQHKLALATTAEDKLHLQVLLSKEMEVRRRIKWTASTIALQASGGQEVMINMVTTVMPKLTDFSCYKAAVQEFDKVCFELDDYEYAYRQLYVLGNLCDSGVSVTNVLSAIRTVCQ